jgi:hypothetical protein
MGLAIIGMAVASPAFAAEPTNAPKTRTVTEVVGYQTTVSYPDKEATFVKLDTNGDRQITFNEFRNNSMHDSPYGVFTMMDKNQNDIVTIDELANFSKTQGGGESNSRFNFNRPKTASIQ